MRRLPLCVVLASALTFLVSLYLRWVEQVRAPLGFGGGGVTGLLDLYSGSAGSYDGWGPFGQAAALCALALVAGAGLSLLRPRLEQIWPLASCAGALLFFTVINAAELRGRGRFIGAFDHFHVRLGAGAYLGIASAAVACLAVAVVRRDELARRPSGTALLAAALTLGLLAAFLLPWLRLHIPHSSRGAAAGYQFVDLGDNAVIFPAALACFGLPLWMRGTSAGRRLAVAVGIAVLTAGNLSVLGTHVHWPYEAWMQLGCSLGLLVLALATGRGLRFGEPSVADAAVVFAASLLVASLFLPWQKACAGGACTSTSGWGAGHSATAGGLALILLVLLVGFRQLFAELAVGAAVYVMAAGFAITQFTHLGYGAPLGFAGVALLLLAAARRLRDVPIDRNRLPQLVPVAACLSFLAIPVAALTSRLSPQLEFDSPWNIYWLGVAAIVVALRLLGHWLGGPSNDAELLLLPFGLLALTALDLLVIRGEISWEGWASVVLCAILVALGWVERNGGLEVLRVPEEIWRVDRLPGEN